MEKVITLLEEIPDSSVYGEAADKAYMLLKDRTTAQAIYGVTIPNADSLLRNLIAVVNDMGAARDRNVTKLIAAIPSVSSSNYFI